MILAAGDRSHIPENARPIFELLSADFARAAQAAPVSALETSI